MRLGISWRSGRLSRAAEEMIQSVEEIEWLEREMSATVSDILRAVEQAFPGAAVSSGSLGFEVSALGAVMEVRMTPGPDRVIALLRLPTLRLGVRFTEGSPQARARLLERFDLATRRGGG